MIIYDISMPVRHDMPVYKGDDAKRPRLTVDRDFQTGSAFESRLEMNMHTGTHVDMPLHMLPGGGTVEGLDLTRVVTPCRVLDLRNAEGKITAEDLKHKEICPGDFILLKTKNSFLDILEGDFVYLDAGGARYLRDKQIKGVGTDGLGIERAQPEHETHTLLLENGIVIMEGLRLADIEEGEYFLFAAPILAPGAEASPARAVLVKGLQPI